MANRKNYSKISTEEAKAKQTEETKVKSTLEPAEPEVTEEVDTQPEAKPEVVKGVVDCARLNVRNNPSLTAAIELVIDKGTEVEIVRSEGDFYHVRKGTTTEGFNGWCMKKYISIKK